MKKIKEEGQEIWIWGKFAFLFFFFLDKKFAFLWFNVICMIEDDDEGVFCDRTLSARNREELKYL